MLPYDYSRCSGAMNEGNLRDTCVNCLRRISPSNPIRQIWMNPPEFISVCPFYISNEDTSVKPYVSLYEHISNDK